MKKLVSGIVIGIVLSFGVTALAGSVKQYILTEVTYPVLVNGKAYKDQKSPILNYQGSTYIPLSKIGELTGVQYKWNAAKKRLELGNTIATAANYEVISDYELNQRAELAENAAIEKFQKETQFTVVNDNPNGYKNLMDADDTQLVLAKIGNEALPPKLSEGWMNQDLISKATQYSVSFKGNDQSIVVIGMTFATDPKKREIWTFELPSDFAESKDGTAEVDGVKMKKYKGYIYFKIADLENIGVLTK